MLKSHEFGHTFEDDKLIVFFGNEKSKLVAIEPVFSDVRIIGVKQTHSNIVIDSTYDLDETPESDAHFTKVRRRALAIRTADCLPVMISASGFVAAIHAGWRGVENEIILKTCKMLLENGANLTTARAWIGPHILFNSFEVGLDVAARLEARFAKVQAFSDVNSIRSSHTDVAKTYLDLTEIAKSQLRSCAIIEIETLEIDTQTAAEHASFRRNGPNAGRNLSFIALK